MLTAFAHHNLFFTDKTIEIFMRMTIEFSVTMHNSKNIMKNECHIEGRISFSQCFIATLHEP